MKQTLGFSVLSGCILISACGGSSEQESQNLIESSPINPTPPVSVNSPTIKSNVGSVTHQAYAKFEIEAEGAVSFECQFNDGDVHDCETDALYIIDRKGEQSLSVWSKDAESNLSEASQFTWTVSSILESDQSNDTHPDLIATDVRPSAVDPNSWRGIFRINCDFSHSSYNDPIVYPNQENAAHLHRFYGNSVTDHATDMSSLYSEGFSTCQGDQLNLSSYWIPALLAPAYDPQSSERLLDATGEPAWKVVPAVVGNDNEAHEIFYYSAAIDDIHAIQTIPNGLRMIAGNHMGQPTMQQDTSAVRWHCQSWGSNDATNPQFSASIPECKAPDRVRMDILFPSCWNGVDLDSDDHKSHMAYPVQSDTSGEMVCPDSHPIALIRVSYHYAFGVKPEVYDPQSLTSKNWRLASDMYDTEISSDGGMSLHGDWFNGWHPEAMQLLLENCIKGQLDCHDGNLANGFRLSGTQAGTQEEPIIVNKGIGY